MTRASRLVGGLLSGLVVLPIVGLAWAAMLVSDGVDNFLNDPASHWVARKAYAMAWVHRDNPIQRVLAPAARVVMVQRWSDHCQRPMIQAYAGSKSNDNDGPSAIAPGPASPFDEVEREYIAQVRFFTFFGYPADDVYISCDGASSHRPLWWPMNTGS